MENLGKPHMMKVKHFDLVTIINCPNNKCRMTSIDWSIEFFFFPVNFESVCPEADWRTDI